MLYRTNSKELPPCRRLPLSCPSRASCPLRQAPTILWRFPARVRTGSGRGSVSASASCWRSGAHVGSALFGAALFRFLPDVEPTMRAVGAALYFGWPLAFGGRDQETEDSRLVPVNGVVSGMLLQFVNPKGILYGITAFSSFVLPYYDSFMALAVSIGVLSAVAYAGTCFWALLEPYSAVSSRTTIPPPTRAWRSCWCGVPLPCIPNYLTRM